MEEIFGYICKCPYQVDISDCPLNELRKSSLMESYKYIKTLPTEELYKWLEKHMKCKFKID